MWCSHEKRVCKKSLPSPWVFSLIPAGWDCPHCVGGKVLHLLPENQATLVLLLITCMH